MDLYKCMYCVFFMYLCRYCKVNEYGIFTKKNCRKGSGNFSELNKLIAVFFSNAQIDPVIYIIGMDEFEAMINFLASFFDT